jgi:hypothetical protein
MGFGSKKVPDTIGDKKMADLSRRARKVAPPMLSKEASDKRAASAKQRDKAKLS